MQNQQFTKWNWIQFWRERREQAKRIVLFKRPVIRGAFSAAAANFLFR